MPDKEITPVSSETLREMTRALPDIPDNRRPLCYNQCVEAAVVKDQITGIGPDYGNE